MTRIGIRFVFDGKAVVEDGRRLVKVKAGREVDLSGGDPMKVRKFDRKMAEDEGLYRWTSLRSSYLAEANVNAANTYVGGGFGWFGDGWYWDPWFDAFTFIPGDGIFYSPFGWGFYSPPFVYATPTFYGGAYYRHFGPNYHALGPRWAIRSYNGVYWQHRKDDGPLWAKVPQWRRNPQHGRFSRRHRPSLIKR